MAEVRNGGFAADATHRDGRVVVVVRGEVDLTTAAEFGRALDAAMRGSDRIEVDLRDTTFMDSTGLAVLVAAHQRLGQSHDAIVVRAPPPRIRKLLEVTGIAALVDIRESG